MSPKEIRELAELRFGGSLTKLAAALDMTYAAVRSWVDDNRNPNGPASILMRQWLNESKGKHGKAKANA